MSSDFEPLLLPLPSKLIGLVPFANTNIQAAIDHALDNLPPDQGDVTLRVGLGGDGNAKLGLVLAKRLGDNWSVIGIAELTLKDNHVIPEGMVEVHGRF